MPERARPLSLAVYYIYLMIEVDWSGRLLVSDLLSWLRKSLVRRV